MFRIFPAGVASSGTVPQPRPVNNFGNFSVEPFEVVVVLRRRNDPATVVVVVVGSRQVFVDFSVSRSVGDVLGVERRAVVFPTGGSGRRSEFDVLKTLFSSPPKFNLNHQRPDF